MLKIGWSKREVSTNDPVFINGQFFVRVSKGIFDPIMMNCLVVDDGDDVIIFLSGDFVNGASIIDDIREKLSDRRPDIPGEKVVFNATHTHCGPNLYKNPTCDNIPHDGIEIYPVMKYRDYASDKAVEIISEAYDTRSEGYIAYGYGYAVVGHSRRSTYSDDLSLREGNIFNKTSSLAVDGHAKMYGSTKDEKFIGYEGGADHFANFMYTFDKDKKLTGAIINIPCPSQNSESESILSADYWNEVRETLYKNYGDIGVISQCAAAGDLSPRCLHYGEAEKRRYLLKYGQEEPVQEYFKRKDIAERICAAFDEVLEWAGKELISNAPVTHSVKNIKLERLLITDDQYKLAKEQLAVVEKEEVKKTGIPEKDMYYASFHYTQIKRFQNVINRYESQKGKPYTDMELHVAKIGDIAFATNSFELYIDYQHQIQAKSPFVQTFIIQLADQPEGNLRGYLATERAMNNLGYSANIYSNEVSHQGGETLVAETLKELNNIR